MAEPDGYSPFDKEGTVAADFLDDFKEYVDTQLNCCPVVHDYTGKDIFCGWVFWSREDDQSEHPPILFPDILDFKKKIKDVLRNCVVDCFEYPILYQFWAPTRTMEGRSYLTSQNQPFALSTFDIRIDDVKGFCGYRMISKDYKFYMDRESSDEQLGVPGRVFKHGFPKFTSNIEYYSIKEYPLRDHALRCQVKLSWAIPLFDLSTHLCVGVLEIVSTTPSTEYPSFLDPDWRNFHNYWKEVGLESSISVADHCKESPSNKDYYANQQTGLRKILETMKKNFLTFKLASREELGGHLYIEEIPFQNGEKIDSVQMSQTTKSLSRLEPLQSGGEMSQLDLSNQQSMDALNNGSNVVSAERSNIDVTCLQEKGKTKRPKRVHNKTGVKIEIPLDVSYKI